MALVLGECVFVRLGICRLAGGADSAGRGNDLHCPRRTKATARSWRLTPRWRIIRSGRTIAVPEHLRVASYQGAKRLGHGQGYEYAHDGKDHFVAQDYLGVEKIYYEPSETGVEKKIKERVEKWRAEFSKRRGKELK